MLGVFATRGAVNEARAGRVQTLEKSASFLEWLFFDWITPLMQIGFKRRLDDLDLWEIPSNAQVINIAKKHAKQNHNDRSSAAHDVIALCRKTIFKQLQYTVLGSLLMYAAPYFLSLLLEHVERPTTASTSKAWLYVLGLFFSMVFSSICNQQSSFIGQHLKLRSRALLSHKILEKYLHRRLPVGKRAGKTAADSNETTIEDDKVADESDTENMDQKLYNTHNLFEMDVQTISEAFKTLHTRIGGVVQVVLAVILLSKLIGTAILAGIFAILVTFGIVRILDKLSRLAYGSLPDTTERRVSAVGEVLNSIRIIKLLSWESQFLTQVADVRNTEMKYLWRRQLLHTIIFVLSRGTSIAGTCTAIGFYTFVLGQPLTATVAFTSLLIFYMMKDVMLQLLNTPCWIMDFRFSNRRITTFLALPNAPPKYENVDQDTRNHANWLGFSDASFCWPTNGSASDHAVEASPTEWSGFVLSDLNVAFKTKEFNVISGPSGSGKTSLLLALIGEMPRIRGKIYWPKTLKTGMANDTKTTNIALITQSVWLQTMSIRDNILFSQPLIEQRYRQVLHACALERDIEMLEMGDRTLVGSQGVTITKSLKQRIALARAVYSSAEYIFMDNCLDALDISTAKHVMEHCLLGPPMCDRTRIMVTNNFGAFARGATYAVALHEGRVIATGEPASVMALSLLSPASKSNDISTVKVDSDFKSGKKDDFASFNGRDASPFGDLISLTDYDDVSNKNSSENITKQGVYTTYFNLSGGCTRWKYIAIVYALVQIAMVGQNYWLLLWTDDHSEDKDVAFYFWIYVLLSGVVVILVGFPVLLVYLTGFYASQTLHQSFMDNLCYATMTFLDELMIGHMMERVKNDFSIVDRALPSHLAMFLLNLSSMIVQLLVISVAIPVFLPLGIIIAIMHAFSVRFFLRTSHHLRNLESQSKAQFYMMANEIASGVAIIRTSGLRQSFLTKGNAQIDTMNRSAYLRSACSHWVISRLEWTSALVTLITASLLLYSPHHFNAALVGFILTYAMTFTSSISHTVNNYSQIESDMTSVERVSEYLNIEQESSSSGEVYAPPEEWPQSGKIEIRNLVVRYPKSQIPALQDISLSIRPGERVGIVGRASSGKTTLAAALFRLIKASSGRIIIDGVDVSKIGLKDLRSRLTIIPEDPGLFSGTLRSNLDPFSMHDDASIWNAVHRSRLISKETSGERRSRLEHLDVTVAENGSNFTSDERRLLGIARALLNNNRIIIMDESATFINLDTEAKIQMIVREEFPHATLLRIAHRMRTVIDYDRVMVLDGGRLVEFDEPAQLLRRPDSLFRQLCEASGELGALMAMARCHLGSTV
ncbi:P-loop containing nucleoside triphosphate hydrolase protein [Syncephalis fuscata]|nr:P-loop containing nucleoside triphosphate hydrolase protein [Syncephalis fuscata]